MLAVHGVYKLELRSLKLIFTEADIISLAILPSSLNQRICYI